MWGSQGSVTLPSPLQPLVRDFPEKAEKTVVAGPVSPELTEQVVEVSPPVLAAEVALNKHLQRQANASIKQESKCPLTQHQVCLSQVALARSTPVTRTLRNKFSLLFPLAYMVALLLNIAARVTCPLHFLSEI